MSIQAAAQSASAVHVYGENGSILATIPVSNGARLLGFTSSGVTVQENSCIVTYNERGAVISTRPL